MAGKDNGRTTGVDWMLGTLIVASDLGLPYCDHASLSQSITRDEVAQIARPRRELKAFKRVELKRGETKRVELRVSVANLGYWTKGAYVVEPGAFTAWIASDSESGRPIGFNLEL